MTEKKPAHLLAELEALFFIHGEPMLDKKIQKLLGVGEAECAELLHTFAESLKTDARGLTLIEAQHKFQLATKPIFSRFLDQFVKDELSDELTTASLETLALILYLGPISRNRLDYIRGVNSAFILRSLLLRGLVERSSDPKNAHAHIFAPSHALLRHLGASVQAELPDFEKMAGALKTFEAGEPTP